MNRIPVCFLCLQMTLRVEGGGKFTRKSKLENQKRNKRRIRRFSKRNKNIENPKYSKRHIRNLTDFQLTPDQT